MRWGNAGEKTFQLIPFGGDVYGEHGFGDLVLPSILSVGWWFDTPRYAPFFRAEITAVTPALYPSHTVMRRPPPLALASRCAGASPSRPSKSRWQQARPYGPRGP